MFGDAKGVIEIRKSQTERKYNDKKKKGTKTNNSSQRTT